MNKAFGTDKWASEEKLINLSGAPLTPEVLEEAAEILRKGYGNPQSALIHELICRNCGITFLPGEHPTRNGVACCEVCGRRLEYTP